ncbi:MFS transporter [Amycolatopsis sp. DSM 110486]|uniref:MFS transporter n=1 Tax=Amycolatopsis sp. DSM 110486 TaxID=2865832 RepID=UPI001C698C33|nr:MFS transporter [Amycolatopsis sp. DSM 110486]QYN19626.1 MFS transporter [Amycolatopsis sp. DSM 110486]
MARRKLGRQFGWLWAAYVVSAYGSGLGFGAFGLIAISVLHSSPASVSALSSASLIVGALVAIPTGPWIETRRKRTVMITMDLLRFAAMATIPLAYWLGWLTYVQLLLVAIVVAAAKIGFATASGAYLKSVVARDDLLAANSRFESTWWSSIAIGPPLGGAAIGLFGYTTTVVADGLSYLLSALGITAIGGREPTPMKDAAKKVTLRDLPDSWRYLLSHPQLRPVFLNRLAVGGLIMAQEPLVAVLMLRDLHFAPWQYGLAFAVPCIGGFVGSRLAGPTVAKYGEHKVMWLAAIGAVLWPIGLAFIPTGIAGLLLVMVIEFGVIMPMSLFNPVVATFRLKHIEHVRLSRTLSAWQISSSLATAFLTLAWGVLAALTSTRIAIGLAGLVLLATPLLLLRAATSRDSAPARTGPPGERQTRPLITEEM